ncbi:hypothetical protein DFJ73DRAFT_540494 [Zopfochytrium polystomum]|nr:hypothetical protein DFJ73DRAFT_540494 [Zopfochytrium polystomum]
MERNEGQGRQHSTDTFFLRTEPSRGLDRGMDDVAAFWLGDFLFLFSFAISFFLFVFPTRSRFCVSPNEQLEREKSVQERRAFVCVFSVCVCVCVCMIVEQCNHTVQSPCSLSHVLATTKTFRHREPTPSPSTAKTPGPSCATRARPKPHPPPTRRPQHEKGRVHRRRERAFAVFPVERRYNNWSVRKTQLLRVVSPPFARQDGEGRLERPNGRFLSCWVRRSDER